MAAHRRVYRLCLIYKMANNLVLMSYSSLLVHNLYSLKGLDPHASIPLDRLPVNLYHSTFILYAHRSEIYSLNAFWTLNIAGIR